MGERRLLNPALEMFHGRAFQHVVGRYHEWTWHRSFLDVLVQLCQLHITLLDGLDLMDWMRPSISQGITPFTSHHTQTMNFI